MAIDTETQRLMENWLRWKTGSPIGLAMSAAYDLEARGRREEMSIPLLNGEALDVDQAVEQLRPELKAVVEQYWLRKGSARQKARACKCGSETFYRRLDQAHRQIREHLRALRCRLRPVKGTETPLCDRNESV